MTDVKSLDFSGSVGYHFTVNQFDSNGALTTEGSCCINPGGHYFITSIANLATHQVVPDIWVATDTFAKVFHATVLADLGQRFEKNLLADATLLEHFSASIKDMADRSTGVLCPWLRGGPTNVSYSAFREHMRPLNITESFIYTNYLC